MVRQLALTECAYEGAFIEVGLKGSENATPKSKGTPTGGAEANSSLVTLLEDYERLKKEKQQQASESARQIQTLQQKNNKLQTDLENAKSMTSLAQRKAQDAAAAQAEAEDRIRVVRNTATEKEQDVNCNRRTVENKAKTCADLAKEIEGKESKLVELEQGLTEIQGETDDVKRGMMQTFDLGKHDLYYSSYATSFPLVDFII